MTCSGGYQMAPSELFILGTWELTLSRPFPCPSAPHASRARLKVSSSPPAISFRIMAILQCIHTPCRPPSVRSPEALGWSADSKLPWGAGSGTSSRERDPGAVCEAVVCAANTVLRSRGQSLPWPVQVIDLQEWNLMVAWLWNENTNAQTKGMSVRDSSNIRPINHKFSKPNLY